MIRGDDRSDSATTYVLQRAILRAAAQRDGGYVSISGVFDPEAAQAAINALLARGWVQAVLTESDMPFGETGPHMKVPLTITDAGRAEAARIGSEQ